MTDLVNFFRSSFRKLQEPRPAVFISGGCQRTGMPLKFIARPLLNRSLIIERIECAEVFPEASNSTGSNTTTSNVYKGNIAARHDLTCPKCGPSQFIVCGVCQSFNCYSEESRSSRRFSCATCGVQAGIIDGSGSPSFVAALHTDRPAPPFHSFEPLKLEAPKAQSPRLLASPTKRLR